MEFLPTTLARCIDTYGVLPEEVSYSILHDVALGLYHLHSHTSPIVHRDLSANNVLLTPNMTAKISDLGVARILNLTPLQMSHMTRNPGTPAYMPPEAMRANPRYDARIDEFSYGILMIHVLSGRWPLPLREPVCVNPENRAQLLPVSEAERRDEYLRDIGNAHPLMDLILRCVSNDPQQRATAAQMVQRMQHMTHHSPPAFPNRVEMLQRIRADATEKGSLREENETFAAEYEQNRLKREDLIQHRAEVEQIHTEITELNAQSTAAQKQLRGEILRLEQLAQHHQEETERSKLAHSIQIMETRLQLQEALQTELRIQTETHQAEMSNQNEVREEERRHLTNQLDSLRSEVSRLRSVNESLQATVASKDATFTQKESELVSKNAILERQSFTIRELNEQLTRAREFLSGQKPQPHPLHPQARITWEPCRDHPVKMEEAQTIIIKDRVYSGGGVGGDEYQVYCYSPSEDTWNTLPACAVRYFGLGQVRGKLVTVGGIRKSDDEVTNEVYEFDEVTQSWKQSIPPMLTARHSPAVLSHHSTLTAAGGYTGHTRTSVVEVYREKTSQWHTTEPLPFHWHDPSSLLINNRWYLLGGRVDHEGKDYSNRAVCANIDILLQKALPHGQVRDSTNNSAWEVLPDTPHYGPTAATFGASLLAVGGTIMEWVVNPPQAVTAVHVYCPCTNAWIHISDLPAPRVGAATAMLSPTELLVISQNSVYKGLLQIE